MMATAFDATPVDVINTFVHVGGCEASDGVKDDGFRSDCELSMCSTIDSSHPSPRTNMKASIKNTFIHIPESDEGALTMRRFNSVPSRVRRTASAFPLSSSGDIVDSISKSPQMGSSDRVNADSIVTRPKLNKSAARWQPASLRSEAVMMEAQVLMRHVKTALESHGRVLTVELLGKSYGMAVALAWIRPEDAVYTESLLTLARWTLLRTAALADDVCILGTSREPFTQRPQGFCAVLAETPADMSRACWHTYENGMCC
jgi:hypothetical protein